MILRLLDCRLITKMILLCNLILIFNSCGSNKRNQKDEQIKIGIPVSMDNKDSLLNSIKGNISFKQVLTQPNSVLITGLKSHRLVTIYKVTETNSKKDRSSYSKYTDDNSNTNKYLIHYMPGFDILYGYNLLNIAHYDLESEKLNLLFDNPVLIKTLYYPSFLQDSLDKKPINRNFYLVSVYNEDTNKDSIINNKDLRRFFYFDSSTKLRIQLVPNDFSVIRSQYDSKNDIMYLFARHDLNKNGSEDKNEPINIFWFSLKSPSQAKQLY